MRKVAQAIEERRAALKVGERITDRVLLTVGMRVYTGMRPFGFDRVISHVSEWGIGFADGGQFGNESIQRGEGWERVTFLGWAQEEKAAYRGAELTSMVVDECADWEAKREKPPAGKPDPTPTGLSIDAKRVKALADMVPQPLPPPKALPFVYLEWCSQKAQHDGKTMCLTCEGLIAEREAGRFVMEPKPQRPEPHRPSPSGMCGPILARLK